MVAKKTPETKRILVICQHFWPESFRINDICDSFIEQGYEVDVLCGIPNYPKGEFYEGYSYFKNRSQKHNGIHIRRAFEIPRGKSSNLEIFLNNISFALAGMLYVPRLLTKKYDQVFMYQLSPVLMAFPGILVGMLKKIPTSMWVIDPWPESLYSFLPIKNTFLRKVITVVSHWHYRHVDKIIVLSDRARRAMLQTTGHPEENIIMLPMACEKVYEERPTDQKLARRFDRSFNIVFAGTITPILSFETVLEATALLKKRGYTNIKWIIIGDGMARQWLEAEVAKLGLGKNFSFEGFKSIQDIPKYTTNVADALFSSLVRNEFLEGTIPAKIPSYLAAGKPIILSMNGAAPELIEKIGCGLSSPAENAPALADNIEKLYTMPKRERQQMGKKAWDYHVRYFERNVVMKTLVDFMERR
jgi:glycosyltransferase involved in cell wall biosynthesis